MKGLKFICVLIICVIYSCPCSGSREIACSGDWQAIHRACYKFDLNRKSWQAASDTCSENGGSLLSIGPAVEFRKITKAIQSRIKTDSLLSWWIGLRRNPDTNKFDKWSDGLPFSRRVTQWSPGEPNNRRNKENCVEIGFDGKLNDKNCDLERPFVCELNESDDNESKSNGSVNRVVEPTVSNNTDTKSVAENSTDGSEKVDIEKSSIVKADICLDVVDKVNNKDEDDNKDDDDNKDGDVTNDYDEYEYGSASEMDESQCETSQNPQADNKSVTEPPMMPTTTKSTTLNPSQKLTPARSNIQSDVQTTVAVARVQEDLSKYRQCYNYKKIVRVKKLKMSELNANYAEFGEGRYCGAIEAGGLMWPETQTGAIAEVPCRSGSSIATFMCAKDPVCWQSQPDLSGCASKPFKDVLKKAEEMLGQIEVPPIPGDIPPPKVEVNVNDTLEVTDVLAKVTGTEDVSAADVMLTSKVMQSLTNTKFTGGPSSEKEVKEIVQNVLKCGSNLVSKNKSAMWSDMKEEEKVRSATTLLVAMESATVNMAESIDTPVVIESKTENIDMELHVLNVTKMASEECLVYGEESNDATFSIPQETLKQLSKGGLAKAVFMTHYQMSDILQEGDAQDANDAEKTIAPQIASYIISASLGEKDHVKLLEPITFTMKHIKEFSSNAVPLCSFLSLSQGSTGTWSQDGCKMIKTDGLSTTCQCDHLTNFAILMDVQGVEISVIHWSLLRFITLVGCIISIICLFICWITFNCFSSIQGERTSIHKNLVFCLFVAEILFLVGIDKTEDKLTCSLIAGFLHYFFLTAFTWMLIEGIYIICMLVRVFDVAKSRLPYYSKLSYYYFVGYGFPLAIVAVSAGVFHEGYGTDRYCWLTTERYFIWSFAGPVAFVLLVNTCILVYAMSTVCRHSKYVFSNKDKSGTDMRAWTQGAMAIEVILGLTWIIGYAFISQETIALAYVFTVFNSLQGLFIFCFHCLLNKKVINEYKGLFHIKKRPAPSTQTASLTKKHRGSFEMSHPSLNTSRV